MRTNNRIYNVAIRRIQRNFPRAYLAFNLRFSERAKQKLAGTVSLLTVRNEVANTLVNIGLEHFDMSKFPVGSPIKISDLEVDTKESDKILGKEKHEGFIERAVKRTISVKITSATVEVDVGESVHGVIIPVNFSKDIIKYGFIREKVS